MAWLSLTEINDMVGGVLHGDDLIVENVTADTRKIRKDDLFVALSGKRFDGHDFVTQSVQGGAAAVMVSRRLDVAVPQIVVEDTLKALGDFASAWRSRLGLVVVALTGSNGKTTTKEMLASILKRCRRVFATRGNLNNHIGVPLSLLSLRREHEVAVIELGANHPGEIRHLSRLAKPDIGLVLNAAPAHLEGFCSLDGVARAKGELFEELPPAGIAVVNADDAYSSYWLSLLKKQRVVRFGLSSEAEVRATMAESNVALGIQEQTRPLNLQLPGRHNLSNGLAASAAAFGLGIDIDTIVSGLEAAVMPPGRLSVCNGVGGIRLIDDSYNANPSSLEAALEVLASCDGRKWLALGDMAELGEEAERWHKDVGISAKNKGVEKLFTVGELAAGAAASFGTEARHFQTLAAMTDYLTPRARSGIVLLVKGSRSAGMERLVEALSADEEKRPC